MFARLNSASIFEKTFQFVNEFPRGKTYPRRASIRFDCVLSTFIKEEIIQLSLISSVVSKKLSIVRDSKYQNIAKSLWKLRSLKKNFGRENRSMIFVAKNNSVTNLLEKFGMKIEIKKLRNHCVKLCNFVK